MSGRSIPTPGGNRNRKRKKSRRPVAPLRSSPFATAVNAAKLREVRDAIVQNATMRLYGTRDLERIAPISCPKDREE